MSNSKKIRNYIGKISRLRSLMLGFFTAAAISSLGANVDFYMWETIFIGLVLGLGVFFILLLCSETSANGKFQKSLKKNPDQKSFDQEEFTCVDGNHRLYLSRNWILTHTDQQFLAYHRSRVQSVSAYGPREDRRKLWMTLQVAGEKAPVYVQYETGSSDALAAVTNWLRTDCPYCGAPLSGNETECPYCHSLLGM